MADGAQVLSATGYQVAFRRAYVGLAVLDADGVPLVMNDRLLATLGPRAHAVVVAATAGRVGSPAALDGESFLLGRGLRAGLHPLPEDDDGRPPSGYLLVAVPVGLGSDPLTGLPGRNALLDRLTSLLAEPGARPGLLVLDLDGFKQVNDRFGHLIGDEVLMQAAGRLVAATGPGESAHRWGGDEFVVLLDGAARHGAFHNGASHNGASRHGASRHGASHNGVSRHGASRDGTDRDDADRARRIAQELARPYRTGAGELVVQASWGQVGARDGESARELLHRADLRMYEVKRARKSAGPAPSLLDERVRRNLVRTRQLHDAVVACAARLAETLDRRSSS